MVEDLGTHAPKYHRVADALRRMMRNGTYPAGQRLPAESALVEQFGVSLPTLRQGLGLLRQEGLIESRHGVGTFVTEQARQPDDDTTRLLTAIDDAERNAGNDQAASRLCAAHRRMLRFHEVVRDASTSTDDMRMVADEFIRFLAEGYGIADQPKGRDAVRADPAGARWQLGLADREER